MGKTYMDRVAFLDYLERKHSRKVRQHELGKNEQQITSISSTSKGIRSSDDMLRYELTSS